MLLGKGAGVKIKYIYFLIFFVCDRSSAMGPARPGVKDNQDLYTLGSAINGMSEMSIDVRLGEIKDPGTKYSPELFSPGMLGVPESPGDSSIRMVPRAPGRRASVVENPVKIEYIKLKRGDPLGLDDLRGLVDPMAAKKIELDLAQISNLQRKNYVDIKDQKEHAEQGFLKSVSAFDWLRNIAIHCGIFVARHHATNTIIGYLLPLSSKLACTLGGEAGLKTCDMLNSLAGNAFHCQLGQICVDREYRRRGYGQKLFEAFIYEYAKHKKARCGCAPRCKKKECRNKIEKAHDVFFTLIPYGNQAAVKFFNAMKLKKLTLMESQAAHWGRLPFTIPYDILCMDLRPGC